MTKYPRKCHYVSDNWKQCYTDGYDTNKCCCNEHANFAEEYVKKVKHICDAVIESGKRRGEKCGRIFCRVHPIDQDTFTQYVKEHWEDAEGDEFGEKMKDLARSWNEGGKDDGLYHNDGFDDFEADFKE